MAKIMNPILRGFNPDPSILRVGDEYYIATSTFEWFPGVQIHHSKDLVHWELLTHALTRQSQLDMLGNPDSGGIWAPCLSFSDGTFYLIFTDVKSHMGPFRDTHNYLVTATGIEGPWSDPVFLNSSGFDPSLFHDDDGRKWLVNMLRDYRKGRNPFGGIVMQEYSVADRRLVGPIYNIFKGTHLGLTEAPHLYKHDGTYYLMVAEGGTRFQHAVTVARSPSLFDPFVPDPAGPLLTAADDETLVLQRAGHGSIVQTQTGEWYMAYLCGRPLLPSMCCTLGRETALQRVEWTADGWLRLVGGGHHPKVEVKAPGLPEYPFSSEPVTCHFDGEQLNIHWNTLREPLAEKWASLRARPGFLRLTGRESLNSLHRQSMIARRQQAFVVEVETVVEFSPDSYQQMAGLIYYYNTKNYYYLYVSHDEELGKSLNIIATHHGVYEDVLTSPVSIEGHQQVHLGMRISGERLQFLYSFDGSRWMTIGLVQDASKISDEYVESPRNGVKMDAGFTGAFVGICVQDLSGQKKYADFDYFTYRELERTNEQ
ncbi:glycoside hydrolase family 43 protein [Alicyclobacillus curvatus]|nr:glycoside hydrolase family 43 protein [Alicyclobacillus curvatus]